MELMRSANTMALALGWLQTAAYLLLGIYVVSQLRLRPRCDSPTSHVEPPRPMSAISTPE